MFPVIESMFPPYKLTPVSYIPPRIKVLGGYEKVSVNDAQTVAFKIELKSGFPSYCFTKLVVIANAAYYPHVTEIYVGKGSSTISKKNTIIGNKAIVKVNSSKDAYYVYYASGEGYQAVLYFNPSFVKVTTVSVSTISGDSNLTNIVEDSVPSFYKNYATIESLKSDGIGIKTITVPNQQAVQNSYFSNKWVIDTGLTWSNRIVLGFIDNRNGWHYNFTHDSSSWFIVFDDGIVPSDVYGGTLVYLQM